MHLSSDIYLLRPGYPINTGIEISRTLPHDGVRCFPAEMESADISTGRQCTYRMRQPLLIYELNDMGQMKGRYHLKTLTWTSNRPFFVDVTTPA
jgi:hypothetical protein